jgi:hypothetical protein
MSGIESLLNRPDPLLLDIVIGSLTLPQPSVREEADSRVHFPLLQFGLAFPPLVAPILASSADTPPPPKLSFSRLPKAKPSVWQLGGYLINPIELGFIPVGHWLPGLMNLTSAIGDFFSARSSRILRFECKLWNALALTRADRALYPYVGVVWITHGILKVNRDVFGQFINVTRPAAALYNKQGSFATHGFKEVGLKDVKQFVPADELDDVEESVVRLFHHLTPLFNAYSRPEEVMACRYVPSSW